MILNFFLFTQSIDDVHTPMSEHGLREIFSNYIVTPPLFPFSSTFPLPVSVPFFLSPSLTRFFLCIFSLLPPQPFLIFSLLSCSECLLRLQLPDTMLKTQKGQDLILPPQSLLPNGDISVFQPCLHNSHKIIMICTHQSPKGISSPVLTAMENR